MVRNSEVHARGAVAASLLAVLLSTSSCAHEFRRAGPAQTLVPGADLNRVELPQDSGLIVYDLSDPVVSTPATFEMAHIRDFSVVLNCSAEDHVVLGVIPTSAMTEDVVVRSRRGEFDSLLEECRD